MERNIYLHPLTFSTQEPGLQSRHRSWLELNQWHLGSQDDAQHPGPHQSWLYLFSSSSYLLMLSSNLCPFLLYLFMGLRCWRHVFCMDQGADKYFMMWKGAKHKLFDLKCQFLMHIRAPVWIHTLCILGISFQNIYMQCGFWDAVTWGCGICDVSKVFLFWGT